MSVWPKPTSDGSLLSGAKGALVSVSINVDPRHVESLLEALAQVRFPINPQIYHDAMMVYCFADGHEETETTTLVDFPAYAGQIEEVQHAVESYGFDRSAIQVSAMLDEIQTGLRSEPAPPGAAYASRYRLKHRTAAAMR